MIEFKIEGNLDRHLLRLAGYIPEATDAGLRAVGQMASGVLKTRIGRIYERQIPLSPTGKPLWKRSGALKASPLPPQVKDGELRLGFGGRPAAPITNWAGGYAARRSKLGVTWFPKAASGTRKRPDRALIRRNDYIGDTQQLVRLHAPVIFEAAFRRALDSK